ncbi:membrane protein [Rhodopirellula maiorica SM1]|uniref:Membrane protein n=1 Tax=Rhodopirellula maiorica SM1 TaxID=1265738 RepID=M5RS27_9BACT|nr:membrane protein [Rhodopirellula maiorica SM1]
MTVGSFSPIGMPLEWLVEGGVWLPLCVLAATVLLVRALKRFESIGNAPHLKGLGAAGWFAIGCTCIAECFDFGILMLPNLLILAAICGAVIGTSTRLFRKHSPRQHHDVVPTEKKRGLRERWLRPFIAMHRSLADRYDVARHYDRIRRTAVLTMLVVLSLVWLDTIRMAHLQAVSDTEIRRLAGLPQQYDQVLANHLGFAESMFADSPLEPQHLSQSLRRLDANPFYKLSVAEAILARQPLLATAPTDAKLSPKELRQWRAIANTEVRRTVYYDQLRGGRLPRNPESALLPGQSIEKLRLANALAREAWVACPLSLRARAVMLMTDFVNEPSPLEDSQQWINETVKLWGYSPSVLMRTGRLALAHPGYPSASPIFSRTLALQPGHIRSLWPLIRSTSDEDAVQRSLPDDPQLLVFAVAELDMPPSLRERIAERARALLEPPSPDDSPVQRPSPIEQTNARTSLKHPAAGPLPDSQRAYLLGRLALSMGDTDEAEQALNVAVRLDPGRTEYRLLYAQTLQTNGKLAEAISQYKRCQLQSPKDGSIREKLRQLSQQRNADR